MDLPFHRKNRDFYTAIGSSHVESCVLMVFRCACRSCVQRAVIYGPLATILYTYERYTRYAFSVSNVHGGEPERPRHTRYFLVQRRTASFHRYLFRASRRHRAMRGGSSSLFYETITGGKRDAVALHITAVTLTSIWSTCKCSEKKKKSQKGCPFKARKQCFN